MDAMWAVWKDDATAVYSAVLMVAYWVVTMDVQMDKYWADLMAALMA